MELFNGKFNKINKNRVLITINATKTDPFVTVCRQTYENYGDTLADFRERGKISFSCERELYKGTAPEQKTKSAKIPENSMFSGILILIF